VNQSENWRTLRLPRSDVLPNLRRTIEAFEQLKQLVGPIVEFHIVVDANVLIQDILWILLKRRNTAARTSLQECIVAKTIIAYVTPMLVMEVEEKLTTIIAERGLTPGVWQPAWANYKSLLHIEEPNDSALERYASGQDPDDAPTLALADTLEACGILSRDSDVAAMGGRIIPIEFIIQARDYSRKAAVSVSIQNGGYFVVVGMSGSVQLLASAVKQCVAWLQPLPRGTEILALAALIIIVLHPKVRKPTAASLVAIGKKLPGPLAQALQITFWLAKLAEENVASPPLLPEIAR
jgi:hypothetical protein